MEYHLSHAMILEGPDPEANLALAKKLAQQAVCTAGGRRPCGVCRNCVKAAGGSHPDIAVYGGKGGSRSFHVEEVRQIRDSAAVMPNEAQAKVYILDGADHMTEQAQNALLKVLEEPPSYVIFLLTCGAASSLLPTVRSRAQIFRVQKEDNPQTEESEAFLLAESMAKAVPSAREYDLVSKTGTLTKDKELFRAVLKELALIFRDACALVAGGESQVTASQAAGYLAQRLTRKKLMALLEAVLEAQAMLERNVNQTLLAAWMCAKLK